MFLKLIKNVKKSFYAAKLQWDSILLFLKYISTKLNTSNFYPNFPKNLY